MRNGTTFSDGASGSTSTSLTSQQDVDDDRMIAAVLSEEYAKLDGAVGRWLTNLAPIPVRSFSYNSINVVNLDPIVTLFSSISRSLSLANYRKHELC